MKQRIFSLISRLGLLRLTRRLTKRRLKILLYHGVSPERGHIFNYRRKFIAPASFEEQMRYISEEYTVLPLDEAIEKLDAGNLPEHPLVITFDDGYRNNYDHAFPILKKYDLPATIFLATDFVFNGKPLWVDRLEYAIEHSGNESVDGKRALDNSIRQMLKTVPEGEKRSRLADFERMRGVSLDDANADKRYAPLTLAMIKEMQLSGITFGAHTKSHPILGRLPLNTAKQEIIESRDMLKNATGTVSSVFAYPNGQKEDWTEDIEHFLKESGFVAALTTLPGTNARATPRYTLKRYSMDNTDDWDTFVATESGVRGILQSLKSVIWRN